MAAEHNYDTTEYTSELLASSSLEVNLTMALVHLVLQATARGEEGMTLFFVCCNPSCGHRWRE